MSCYLWIVVPCWPVTLWWPHILIFNSLLLLVMWLMVFLLQSLLMLLMVMTVIWLLWYLRPTPCSRLLIGWSQLPPSSPFKILYKKRVYANSKPQSGECRKENRENGIHIKLHVERRENNGRWSKAFKILRLKYAESDGKCLYLLLHNIREQTGWLWRTGNRHKPKCKLCSLPPLK